MSSDARKISLRHRPSVFGIQLSVQLAMLAVASLTLGVLVAVAVFEWISRS